MKKILFYLIFFILGTFSVSAQDQPDEGKMKGENKLKALYIAYITQELKLNEAEAQKFWPLHGQFDSELKAIHHQNLRELEREESALNVKKRYQEKFSKVIGNARTERFYRKDGEFRNKLVERLHKHQMDPQMNRMPKRHPRP